MCGIAGILSFNPQHRVTRETLAKMSACIAHRGPDGDGLWLNHEDEPSPDRPQVGLVHRRLAILDPDPRSNQPFTDGRGRWIVFNGEIYNFRELRKELTALHPSFPWRTNGDTEVLLAAYAEWGKACVDHLNGMFVFAVWDEGLSVNDPPALFLARDRMGQKPLYIRATEDSLVFASELAAIPQSADPSTHPIWLSEYLQYGCLSGVTPWLETVRLPAGGLMVVGKERESNQYFDAGRFPTQSVDDAAARKTTREKIFKAVERQLVSDVPLGVFLSGGIDSSVIASTARILGPINTFSIRFDDSRYDESEYAQAVAKHIGSEHHEFSIKPDAADDLLKLAAVFGEPFADSSALPTHYLSRETRKHVKVALSGDGGDELFGGYDRYRAIQISESARAVKFLQPLGHVIGGGHPKSTRARAARFLQSLGQPTNLRYDSYLRVFDDAYLRKLMPGVQFLFPIRAEAFDLAMRASHNVVKAATACDRMRYLPDDLLTKVDRASMLHALEVRAPFMDHELVQFAAGLTTDQLLKGGGKRMLREAFAADLPAWVFKRKKMGFAVPIGDWFRGPLRAMLHDHLFAADSFASTHFNLPFGRQMVEQHEAKTVDHSQRLYALLMLELWWKGQK